MSTAMSFHCLYLLKNFTSIDFTHVASSATTIASQNCNGLDALKIGVNGKEREKKDVCNQKAIDNGAK